MFKIPALVNFVVFVLNAIYKIVGNYGIAIIIVTVLMRIIIFPLTLKQEKSMKKMREIQPEMDELYREAGVNPLGGCLPLLIQLPIFVALYYAFMGEAIPNDAKFLWFTLKQPDKLFMIGTFALNLLPILNVVITFVQQKMMATPGQDNQQMQTMMYMMPIMMLFIFYNMPSGVTLYYLVSGVLSLVQQYFIMKGRD